MVSAAKMFKYDEPSFYLDASIHKFAASGEVSMGAASKLRRCRLPIPDLSLFIIEHDRAAANRV